MYWHSQKHTSTRSSTADISSSLPYSDLYAPLTIRSVATCLLKIFSIASDISPTEQRARDAYDKKILT